MSPHPPISGIETDHNGVIVGWAADIVRLTGYSARSMFGLLLKIMFSADVPVSGEPGLAMIDQPAQREGALRFAMTRPSGDYGTEANRRHIVPTRVDDRCAGRLSVSRFHRSSSATTRHSGRFVTMQRAGVGLLCCTNSRRNRCQHTTRHHGARLSATSRVGTVLAGALAGAAALATSGSVAATTRRGKARALPTWAVTRPTVWGFTCSAWKQTAI